MLGTQVPGHRGRMYWRIFHPTWRFWTHLDVFWTHRWHALHHNSGKNMLELTSKLIRGILNFPTAIQDGRLAIYLVCVGLSVILQKKTCK